MSFYSAPFTFDFDERYINVDVGIVSLDCVLLYAAIKLAQTSEAGVIHPRIASGTGRNMLGPGVRTALTLELLPPWQLRFSPGAYSVTISGGNLIGGLNGDPIADCPGATIVLIQSAAATIVTSGGSAPAADIADAVWGASLDEQTVASTAGAALKRIRDNTGLIPALL
jgi:hypothetical protein